MRILTRREVRDILLLVAVGLSVLQGNGAVPVVPLAKSRVLTWYQRKSWHSLGEKRSYYIQIFNILTL